MTHANTYAIDEQCKQSFDAIANKIAAVRYHLSNTPRPDNACQERLTLLFTEANRMVDILVMHPGQRAASRQELSRLKQELNTLGIEVL